MIFEIDTVVNQRLSHGMPLPAPGGEGKLGEKLKATIPLKPYDCAWGNARYPT